MHINDDEVDDGSAHKVIKLNLRDQSEASG